MTDLPSRSQNRPLVAVLVYPIATLIFSVVISLASAEIATRMILAPQMVPDAVSKESYLTKLKATTAAINARQLNRLLPVPEFASDQNIQHPFIGFIPRQGLDLPCGPSLPTFMCVSGARTPINSLGLYEKEFAKVPTSNTVRIGIVGGSVANLMVQTSRDLLTATLQKSASLDGHAVEILNLAIPGFKQPQQTNLIVYLLTQGYHFDAIVNIAGLNEVYLSRHYNMKFGAAYSYPFIVHWYPSPPKVLSDQYSRTSEQLQETEDNLALSVALSPTNSFLANLAFVRWIALSGIHYFENNLLKLQKDTVEHPIHMADKDHSYGAKTNDRCADPKCVEDRALLWLNGALMTDAILKIKGIRYFEILQPNHYTVPRSTLSVSDRNRLNDEFGWERSDMEAWTKIQNYIAEFSNARTHVKAIDLSDPHKTFNNAKEGVLVDACCHLNRVGYDALAIQVGSFISSNWDNFESR